ncbi:hypothetical protein MLD52_01635 [Puniceicoccaceae bacterium K14]|nr:hypothetical protein [Puniceicoccaceae bacterium K14]
MQSDKIRYALISRQRSGTKFLKLTLSKHPEIFTHKEVLSVSPEKSKRPHNVHRFMMDRFTQNPSAIIEDRTRHNYSAYIEYLYESSNSPIVGLDLKYNQLNQFTTFKSCLEKANIRVIHLIRKNVLRQYLSALQYKLLDGSKIPDDKIYEIGALPITPAKLPCDSGLLNILRAALEQIEQYRTYLKAHFPYCEIHYESFIPKGKLISNEIPQPILQGIYNFLGVSDKTFSPLVTRKSQHPYLIKELVSNYDELEDFLNKSDLGYLLDENFNKS